MRHLLGKSEKCMGKKYSCHCSCSKVYVPLWCSWLVIPSNLGDSTVGATRRAWRTLFTTFCPRGRIRRIRREGDNITGMLAFAIVDTTSRLLLLNHDMAGVIHVELSRGTRAGIMITAPSTVQWPACIFFSPTNFTFSPTLSLFRQVGSLFRHVGSLFRHKRIF